MNSDVNSPPVRKMDWVSLFVTFLVLVWVVGVSLAVQFAAALASALPYEILQRGDLSTPQIMVGAALLEVAALLLFLVPLALWWRAPRYRAAFRAWLVATLFVLLLAPIRLFQSTYPQEELLLQTLLALIFSCALWFVTGRGKWLGKGTGTGLPLAAALGIFLALPWLLWGALGSPFDVLLGILAALAFGLVATLLITRVWIQSIQDSGSPGWNIVLGGFVVSALLLILGSAYGFIATQLLLMLTLGACGWLVMALGRVGLGANQRQNDVAIFALITLVIAAPLLFLDPDAGVIEATFAPGEVLEYAFRAIEFVAGGTLLLGFVLALLQRWSVNWMRARLIWLAVGALVVIAGVVYVTQGQPGFYGDRVFVILKDQADVSAAKTITDYGQRRTFVYKTLTDHAARTQQDLRATLDRFGIAYTPYYLVNGFEVSADLPVQWWLQQRGDVAEILPSPHLRPLPKKPETEVGRSKTPPTSPQWNQTLIGAARVWNELGVRGQGILVGQSDTGVDGLHPELAAQYRGRSGDNNFSWIDPWYHTSSPTDVGGHGTHTLGSILGKNVGVAPDAEWIGCVNLARNLGDPPLYLNCLQFMLAPYPQNGDPLRDGDATRGAMVLNNSWGCPEEEGCDANVLLPAVRALREAGVFVVASAGNDGPDCSTIRNPIALYGDVFSVGAIDRNKRLASFSSRGPVLADKSGRVKPDLAAPGVGVNSALPGGTYGALSGTSMAGPHVVGVVALMWSANPKLIGDIDATEQILRETAQRGSVTFGRIVCGDPNAVPNDLDGYGVVDAYAAVQRAIAEK